MSASRQACLLALVALPVALAVGLTGCGSDAGGSDAAGVSIVVGTTDRMPVLDPAAASDEGSFAVLNQVFPFLMNVRPGSSELEPDIASAADFTPDGDYRVVLKSGLRFANGNDLTSSDVKLSFDRQLAIADAKGPSALLGNLDRVETPDDTTVVFRLKQPHDQSFPRVLASQAGLIVDEQVFSADAVTGNDDILKGMAFAGPYTITDYVPGELVTFVPNARYQGLLGTPKNREVRLRYYTDASNLRNDLLAGTVDVAFRGISADDLATLRDEGSVTVVDGPGGETRYLVFNLSTMPYGTATADADPAKALAVRRAMADVVDRAQLAKRVYADRYLPLFSDIPSGVAGAAEALRGLYGDGSGGPDIAAAKTVLEVAGVATPIALTLSYTPEQFGSGTADEYALLKSQLEGSRLFTVTLNAVDGSQYADDRANDLFQVSQSGRSAAFADAANYLMPLFGADDVAKNHYANASVRDDLAKQLTEPDPAARLKLIAGIQAQVAAELPTLPLLQSTQYFVTGNDVSGAVVDASHTLRFGTLTRNGGAG